MYDESSDFAHHDREVDEMLRVLAHHNLHLPDKALSLDVGGGQGMHVWKLLPSCSRVFVADVLNYSQLYDGHFLHLLHEKHERNSRPFDLSKVTFLHSDAQSQIFRDEAFDFVFSFNMFEHVPNPALALSEAVRVLKAGGVFYLQFDPIWMSPEGHHFSHRVPEPWAHLLSSTEEFTDRMRKGGAEEWEVRDFVYTLNRWTFHSFADLFREVIDTGLVEVKRLEYWATNREDEPRSAHPNFARLLDMGYSEQDLLVRGVRFCGRKLVGL